MPEPTAPNPEQIPLDAFAEEFLRISRRELDERRQRIETCVAKLSPEQIWSRHHENENAAGNLILHLCGNVRQWIISGVGGAPDHRDRDAEFARREPLPSPDLVRLLRDTLSEADEVLARLKAADLLTKRRIQAYDVTVLHAIYHVVEHFGQHTGQIIWITKWLTGEDLGFYRYLQNKKAAPGKEP
jgi:uncharacterized damage-inducible protein DinB